ncbi:MAG TPA: FtsX-like permease family protein [Bradyrhizobium sp.]|nr:FtsX-like permease family protein [Bradyrhizobium sp.]
MNELTLIRKNLLRKKVRAGLMLVSIIVAFAIFGVLAGFERAFNGIRDAVDDDRLIVVNKLSFTRSMPLAHYSAVRSIEGVRKATYLSWFAGYYQQPANPINVFAVEPETWTDINENYYDFPPAMRQAFIRNRTGALVGEMMARKWGWKVGDRIPITSNIFAQKNGSKTWDVTIDGTFTARRQGFDSNLMIFQWDYFNESRTLGKDLVLWIPVKTTGVAINDAVAQAIDDRFVNSSNETSTDTDKAFRTAFAAQFGNIALVVKLVIGTAFLTLLMIVGNTMMMAVRERRREIAVLKTLGFSSGRVLRLVLSESVLLALIGGLPGLGIAALLTWYLRDTRISNSFPGITISPEIALVAISLMVCFGVAAGLLPALNAWRDKIVEGLGRG